MARAHDSDAPSVWASGPPRGRRLPPRRLRRALTTVGIAVAALLGLWFAVHRVPWVGPMFADGLRKVIGTEGVARLEDFVYGVEDQVNLAVKGDEAPRPYWVVPSATGPSPASHFASCELPAFAPRDVGPMLSSWSAPGDGIWVPVTAPAPTPGESPRLFKTLLHPDANRSWAAVSVVAVDLQRVELHLMAGTREPAAATEAGEALFRPGVIPSAHHASLLAAFNGGFKAEHGHYGMNVDGVTLIAPRSLSCWVAHQADGGIVIGDYERLQKLGLDTTWWRQTPGCMIDEGELHPGLADRNSTYWGATLNGKTVIRRSAIGISRDHKTLFSGIGDHTSARAMALAMRHAGAAHVAQLDVNWSYPKFVVYESSPTGPRATKLCDGFEFSEDEYVGRPSERDFFYLTTKTDEQIEKAECGR